MGIHRTVQLQLLQHYCLGHRLGLPWYWMACLGDEQRSFCHFWDCIQVLRFGLFCWPWWLLHFFFASGGQNIGASASASVLPKSIQGWFPLGLTSLISLLSKGLYAIPQFESINSVIYRKSFVMSNYFPNNIKLLFVICTVLICTLIVQRQILAPQNKLRQWQQTFSSHCIIHCHTLTVRKQTPPISLYALD